MLHLVCRPNARHQQPAALRLRGRQQRVRELRRRRAALQQQSASQMHLHFTQASAMLALEEQAGGHDDPAPQTRPG